MLRNLAEGVRRLENDGYPKEAKRIKTIVQRVVSNGFNPDSEQIPEEFLPRKKIRPEEEIKSAKPGADVIALEKLRVTDNPILDVDRILYANREKLSAPIRDFFNEALNDIKEKNNESLFHLGMPTRVRHLVVRSGITTINELRSAANEFIHRAGPVAMATIKDALKLYDARWEQKKQTRRKMAGMETILLS